jgi:hypothetical protein
MPRHPLGGRAQTTRRFEGHQWGPKPSMTRALAQPVSSLLRTPRRSSSSLRPGSTHVPRIASTPPCHLRAPANARRIGGLSASRTSSEALVTSSGFGNLSRAAYSQSRFFHPSRAPVQVIVFESRWARSRCATRRVRSGHLVRPGLLSGDMDTVATSARGSRRGSQDETPFPIELEIVARRKRVVRREGRSQDETAPFPLEFEVVARRAQQDETSPFLLEFNVVLPDGQAAFVRTARPPRARGAQRSTPRALPVLKWHGVNASLELREYAARIASGESLPPYQGPILANGALPRVRPAAPSAMSAAPSAMSAAPSALHADPRATTALPADDSKGLVKLALALIVMTALVLASAVLGDDTQLRGIGQSISRWVTGRDSSFETLRPAAAAKPAASKSSAPHR